MVIVAYSLTCVWLCNPTNYSPLASSVHGIPRQEYWFAIFFSRGSSWPRDRTWESCICRQILYQMSHQERSPFWHCTGFQLHICPLWLLVLSISMKHSTVTPCCCLHLCGSVFDPTLNLAFTTLLSCFSPAPHSQLQAYCAWVWREQ